VVKSDLRAALIPKKSNAPFKLGPLTTLSNKNQMKLLYFMKNKIVGQKTISRWHVSAYCCSDQMRFLKNSFFPQRLLKIELIPHSLTEFLFIVKMMGGTSLKILFKILNTVKNIFQVCLILVFSY
jgi:hypothetical protein